MVPWFAECLDETLPMNNTGLERSISDYVRHDVYITPSGMFSGSQCASAWTFRASTA